LQAVEYSKGFDHHSYLWLEDRQVFLKQFLLYSHQLTSEELEIATAAAANEELPGLKESRPTTKQFKDQVITPADLRITRVCKFIRGKIHVSKFTYLTL
jgi:dynein heavy chain